MNPVRPVRVHALVRTPPPVLMAQAAGRHHEECHPLESSAVRPWFVRPHPDALAWRSQVRGGWDVQWRLDAEPAANGTLAHLGAVVAAGYSRPASLVASAALALWVRSELDELVRSSEVLHGPYQRLAPWALTPAQPDEETTK